MQRFIPNAKTHAAQNSCCSVSQLAEGFIPPLPTFQQAAHDLDERHATKFPKSTLLDTELEDVFDTHEHGARKLRNTGSWSVGHQASSLQLPCVVEESQGDLLKCCLLHAMPSEGSPSRPLTLPVIGANQPSRDVETAWPTPSAMHAPVARIALGPAPFFQ
jgi:hypothetical protein